MNNLEGIKSRLRLPVMGAPLFIISTPKLVVAQCKSGIVGSFPALNARPSELLDEWLSEISEQLKIYDEGHPDQLSAPFAVNQIVHRSNKRLQQDMEIIVKHQVPIVITSLGARKEVYEAVHSYGGMVLHDVINNTFAKKAIDKGADGLIAVAAGAGGHAGTISPFSLVQEIREWFSGPLALAGSIATGGGILAAQVMGADFAYIGSPFIATEEANAHQDYKTAIVECGAEDIVYSNFFTGVAGNYLRPSIVKAGFDPDHLPASDPSQMDFTAAEKKFKAWKDIWGCGQGIGAIKEIASVQQWVQQLSDEYVAAQKATATMS